ncbi:MAG: helix-turn-helix transcriptional regulator [Clostridiales bacterium]|nr:helix-turn-helix transcriptional regulator [Clostridiales bacterium]
MEFNEKLQELRKQRGLTQEELAELLYVSRTAVSKWKSGRGYPNIDSLKAISKCFPVMRYSPLRKKKAKKRKTIPATWFLDCSIAVWRCSCFFLSSVRVQMA